MIIDFDAEWGFNKKVKYVFIEFDLQLTKPAVFIEEFIFIALNVFQIYINKF